MGYFSGFTECSIYDVEWRNHKDKCIETELFTKKTI